MIFTFARAAEIVIERTHCIANVETPSSASREIFDVKYSLLCTIQRTRVFTAFLTRERVENQVGMVADTQVLAATMTIPTESRNILWALGNG